MTAARQILAADGVRGTVAEHARRLDLSPRTIYSRISDRDIAPEEACAEPRLMGGRRPSLAFGWWRARVLSSDRRACRYRDALVRDLAALYPGASYRQLGAALGIRTDAAKRALGAGAPRGKRRAGT